MKLSLKKLPAILAALVLTVTGVTVASAPAHAADCPYPVADPASNDHPKANIRLISPVLTDDNSVHRTELEIQFTEDCDWFGVGTRFNQVYVPFGQNVTMTFHATNPAGAPLANTRVKLRGNKGYSGSNAPVRINGVKARPAPSNASDGADVYATTDAYGNVSYMIMSPDSCETYGGKLPAAPGSLTDTTPNDLKGDPTEDCYSQFLPEITGEKTDSSDFVEFHYYDASAEDNSADSATVSAMAPVLNETNAIVGDGVTQAYALVGTTQVMAFQALKDDGTYARNLPVKVKIGMEASGSNASVSAGLVGNTMLGASTTLTAANMSAEGDQLVLSGTTDAFGTVTFLVKNTDTTGETQPSSMTAAPPVSGAKFSRITAELDGVETMSSEIEMHYYKPTPPTTITITAVGRKITVTINNAIGKTSTISITGKAKITLKPTVAKKVLTYTLTKGVKKIVVTANGKTLTKTFTLK